MVVEVTVPFNSDTLDMDPAAIHGTADKAMSWIVDEVPYEDQELVDILTSAVCLHAHHKGAFTFGQCLENAIIWSRG
jgi:hypothetical protein